MFDGHTLRATKGHGLWLPSSEIARESN
jgi:hypothetical protein